MKISDVVSGMLRGRVAGAAAGVLGMVASLTAFEWTFNRHYVPDGCSLVLRYKGHHCHSCRVKDQCLRPVSLPGWMIVASRWRRGF